MRPLLLLVAVFALGLSTTPVAAQDDSAKAATPAAAPNPIAGKRARLPIRIIGGRMITRCDLSTRARRIPVNLFIDFDRACRLELHNQAANGMKVDTGQGLPITIHMSGFNITVPRREHGDEDLLNEFTKLYSRELGETACVGTIGLEILRDYHLTFDLARGFLTLEPPHEKTDVPPEEIEGTILNAITLTNDQVWVPVRMPDKVVKVMNLATSRYDSLIDEDVCEALSKPAGDIGAVSLKTTELTKFIALRPAELAQVHADGVLGTLGLNVFAHFEITIDRVNRFVRFRQRKAPSFPKEDVEGFAAMVEEDPEALQAWLIKHPGKRLAREIAGELLTLLVDSGEPKEKFKTALEWMDKTRIEDLRSTEALTTMKMLLEAQRPDVAILAGKIGVESGRKDRYAESIHKLHGQLGELILDHGKAEDAWEHLLSAAFGLPQDGRINLNLGRFYESQKRYKRAMSRYVQAVIQPESGPLAIPGLERVQKAMGGAPLSVDLVDKLIAGKVYNFGAATRFKPSAATKSNRTVLVELFTNPHLSRRLAEGWRSFNVGGVMGQEGLLTHFPRERVAVVTYHVADPEPSALINELSTDTADLYGDTRPVYMKVNGIMTGPGAGRSRDAEKIYNRNRAMVTQALGTSSDYLLSGTAKVEKRGDDHVVIGEILVDGKADPNLRVQVMLVERGVLYPGKGLVVVHRMVARGVLTEHLAGEEIVPAANGKMKLPFSRALSDVKAKNEAWLTRFEKRTNKSATRLSTGIDPRQVCVVAIIRNSLTQEVLQAVHIDATQPAADGGPK